MTSLRSTGVQTGSRNFYIYCGGGGVTVSMNSRNETIPGNDRGTALRLTAMSIYSLICNASLM